MYYCRFLVKNPVHNFSMYFFERTLVGVLPTHTVSGRCQRTLKSVPGGGVRGGARRPTPHTDISIHAPFGCPANLAHTNTNTRYTASTIQAPFGCHRSTVRLPCQPSARGAFWDTHTKTNTHYTASSSIKAPFGCPANPAMVVHALERLRLCCSIVLVRGIWDNEHNTNKQHVTSLCPGLRKKDAFPQTPPRPYKIIKFEQRASNQTALRTTPSHANNQLVVHFGTHTPRPIHTTLLVVASKHRSAVLPTQRWWCMRWNVCDSAIRSCSCGAFGTTNTTHTKNISLRCALGCGNKIPSPKTRLVLTKP